MPLSTSCPPQWGTPRNPDAATHGPNIAYYARILGTPLMEWQQHVVDVATEVNPETGLLRYREIVLTVPRQSGKTTLLLAKALWRCIALGAASPQRMIYTAQTRNDAKQKFEEDQVPLIWYPGSPFAPHLKGKPRTTNGAEGLRFKNNSTYGLIATTEKSGHGKTLDDGTIDEAFAQVDTRLEQAFVPAMNTRPQPQLWVVSTAGWSDRPSYLYPKIENGRELVAEQLEALNANRVHPGQTAYFEWSCPEDLDPFDEANWPVFMPAVAAGLTSVEAVRWALDTARTNNNLADWLRAYANRWVASTTVVTERPISPEAFKETIDESSTVLDPVVFAVGVASDETTATIAVVGRRRDGALHAEILEQRHVTSVIPRLIELRDTWNPKAIGWCKSGPAGKLGANAIAAGLEFRGIGSMDLASAYSDLRAEITTVDNPARPQLRRIYHRDSPVLTAAVEGAVKRSIGSRGEWVISLTGSDTDPSPLEAVAVGVHLFKTNPDAQVTRSAYEDEDREAGAMYV